MPVTEAEIDAAGDHLGLGDGVVGRADVRRALEAAERAREGKKRGTRLPEDWYPYGEDWDFAAGGNRGSNPCFPQLLDQQDRQGRHEAQLVPHLAELDTQREAPPWTNCTTARQQPQRQQRPMAGNPARTRSQACRRMLGSIALQ